MPRSYKHRRQTKHKRSSKHKKQAKKTHKRSVKHNVKRNVKRNRNRSVQKRSKLFLSRKHKRNQQNKRRHTRKHMRGGVRYVASNANFSGVSETVPYKVGTGVNAGELPLAGQNHYSLSPTSIHEPNGTAMNTSLHTSVPKTFMSGGGGLRSLMPQDLVDMGRSIIGTTTSAYDTWVGQPSAPSANVLEQPIANETSSFQPPLPIKQIATHAESVAASS